MKLKNFIIPFLSSLFFVNVSMGQTDSFNSSEQYSRFVKKQMDIEQIPGLSVGVQYGDFEWSKGYGYIDLENEVKTNSEAAYRLASNTKSMTAVAILQLYEDNKLDLDDPVRKYVPYFPRKEWGVTIRQVMGHIGGISHYKDYEKEGHIKEPKDTREAVEIFDDFELLAEPGTEYNYSSYGYNLLGAVIEGAAKKPFGQFVNENIWQPLNMNNTYMDVSKEILPNRAQGYRLIFGKLYNSEYVDITSRFAAGGTLSTVPDLLKYARGLNQSKVLSDNSVEMMETSMSTTNGKLTDYGMGWRIEPVNGHFMAYHTGGQPETRTILIRFPAMELNIACAYNLEGGNLYAFPRRLYQFLKKENWNIKPYTTNEYDKALIDGLWDVYNYGLAYYERHENEMPGTEEKLKKMFMFLNRTLNPDSLNTNFEEIRAKINLGRHPRAHQAYVRIGSFMAEKLAEANGKESLDKYHKNGALPFFEDYIKLSRTFQDTAYHINEAMKKKIMQYNNDWSNSWNDYTRMLWFAPFEKPDDKLDKLAGLFEEKSIYPDFTTQIAQALWKGALKTSPDKYLPAAKKFTALYPESAVPQMILANLYVLKGKKDEVTQALDNAMRADVDRYVLEAGRLNYYAEQLFREDKMDLALMYLEVVQSFYPENGTLEDTKGDIFLEKSRRAFRNALDLDPTLQDTWERLKEIE